MKNILLNAFWMDYICGLEVLSKSEGWLSRLIIYYRC